MEYLLDNNIINVKIIRKNIKNLYMRFENTNTLLVTCNLFIREKEIMNILKKNMNALLKMYDQKKKEEEKESYFYYLGTPYIPVLDGITKTPTFDNQKIIAKDQKTLDRFYQKECNRIFQSEIERIIPFFENIPKFTLKIRNMKTRWGVNNRGNNTITLNSELLKKDLDLLDYVIIHELCHFYEANHSKAFWKHVEEYYPKYKEARKRLRG